MDTKALGVTGVALALACRLPGRVASTLCCGNTAPCKASLASRWAYGAYGARQEHGGALFPGCCIYLNNGLAEEKKNTG